MLGKVATFGPLKLPQNRKPMLRMKQFLHSIRDLGRLCSHTVSGNPVITLDYPLQSNPRYGFGKPPHQGIQQVLEQQASSYRAVMKSFCSLIDFFQKIPLEKPGLDSQPYWKNPFFSGLDAVALYSFTANLSPSTFLEIGSGQSTKFARCAIENHRLPTKIISIDPHPRAEVDDICDEIIRSPLEDVDPTIFDRLQENDILFYDGSHRALMNSDVTAFFLDIFPRIQPGVYVHIHDIFLPHDYPPDWKYRYYSEQYLLATLLLAKPAQFETVLPNHYISNNPKLSSSANPIWEALKEPIYRSGVSFWLKTTAPR